MLGRLLDLVKCPVCIDGNMHISVTHTFNTYAEEFDVDDIDKLEDEIINEYWVFVCDTCGTKQKLNFRDIEKMARKELSRRLLKLKATTELNKTINVKTRYFVYCGVCSGFDSNGSCPQMVYDECQLRRLPSVI